MIKEKLILPKGWHEKILRRNKTHQKERIIWMKKLFDEDKKDWSEETQESKYTNFVWTIRKIIMKFTGARLVKKGKRPPAWNHKISSVYKKLDWGWQ